MQSPEQRHRKSFPSVVRIGMISALQGLHHYRTTALLLGIALLAAICSILPLAHLFGAPGGWLEFRPSVRPIPGGDLALPWLMGVASPSVAQEEAVSKLGRLLLYALSGTIVVGLVTIILIGTARWAERRTERLVQRAVGASRRALLAGAWIEAVLLAVVPGSFGSMIAIGVARAAETSWPGAFGSGPSGLGALAAALVLGVFAGVLLMPAIMYPRRIEEAQMRQPLPTFPVVLQIAVSFIVLSTGTLLTDRAKELGSITSDQAANGTVVSISMPPGPAQQRSAQFRGLLDGLADAGMHSVSLTSPGTLSGLGYVAMVLTDCGRCTEAGMQLSFRLKPAAHKIVSADTFRLVGLPVLAGRGITAEDDWDSPRVAVVSRSLAAREFQDGNPIGRRIHTGDDDAEGSTVVGIVASQFPIGLGGTLQPRHAVYVSVLQHPPRTVDLLIRDPSSDAILKRTLEETIGRRSGHYTLHSERAVRNAEIAPVSWFGRRFEMQGWALVALASLGIIGFMGMWVQSLVGEIAVRRSIGARRNQILLWVLGRASGVAIKGVVVGVWFGIAIWGTLPEVVNGTAVSDPSRFVPYAALMAGLVLSGVLLPAWRASRARPADLLHTPGS